MYAKQRGVTLLGWIAILAVIGFFAIFTMKLVPAYTQKLDVHSLMEALDNEFSGQNASPVQLRKAIVNKFQTKSYEIIDVKSFVITPVKGGHDITIAYEHPSDLFLDIGLVVKVNETVHIER
ncbi:MAG: DUF4845 domain-containing protein [Gammaproteobacteria bacterium]|nr:DUF4845 domain-containing protein [Gammaproteobacteria bacterium]NND58629.1 DUF4845 domain-containing protein [Gammaproteobacteria bacterium]